MPRYGRRYRYRATRKALARQFSTSQYRQAMAYATRRSVMKSAVKIKQPVQYFKRTVYLPTWNAPASGADRFTVLNFRLNQLPNVTEFTQLYDQYKICGVKVEVIPQFDTATQTGTGTTPTAQHIVSQNWNVIDYDDTVTPTSINDLLQYQNCKRCPSNRVMKRFLKPKFSDQIFASGAFAGYRPAKGFIDCTYDNVEHYGMKFCFGNSNLTLTYALKMTFYMAFKNVR